ncbi:MAG: serine/threonine-protein kinase [Anaerolineaceae bacterium]|nr:serine/threonine-protein kinase [Anaerolineaceae bacterium]
MPFAVGETVGAYNLVAQLGQGGMATVYKAYHSSLDRFVAIKVLHYAFMDDPNFLARFQREARVVAKLEHPNIVPVYDFSEFEGRPYLVMKFIEGETLKDRLEKGPLAAPDILRVVDSVGAALAYAHRQNILHRDIKPSNVLLGQDGQIYLADFGLARLVETGESSLTADRMVGTPQYISPEQALSKPDLDARSDIYSFGVMLYELTVGKVPFNAESPFSIIHDQIYTPLPMPRQLNPQISKLLEQVLLKALAKDPNERYSDVNALVQSFHSALPMDPAGQPLQSDAINTLAVEGVFLAAGPSTPSASVAANPLPAGQLPATIAAGVESQSPTPAKPARKKIKTGWLIVAIAGGLILLFACLVLGAQVLKNGAVAKATRQAATQAALQGSGTVVPALLLTPPAAVQLTTPTPSALASALASGLQIALNNAVASWSKGNMQDTDKQLDAALALSGGDVKTLMNDIRYLDNQRAWLPAALLIGKASQPGQISLVNISADQIDKIHEVFYNAAKDPLSGSFFNQTGGHPLMVVAKMRYQLYYGDAALTQQQLDRLLGMPLQLKRFPEAKLLQVELSIHNKNLSLASDQLTALLADSTLPVWVNQAAQNLKKQLNP